MDSVNGDFSGVLHVPPGQAIDVSSTNALSFSFYVHNGGTCYLPPAIVFSSMISFDLIFLIFFVYILSLTGSTLFLNLQGIATTAAIYSFLGNKISFGPHTYELDVLYVSASTVELVKLSLIVRISLSLTYNTSGPKC